MDISDRARVVALGIALAIAIATIALLGGALLGLLLREPSQWASDGLIEKNTVGAK